MIFSFYYTGCASTGFLMEKAKVTLFGEIYPFKEADEKIDIYLTALPMQEYIEFAQIICAASDDDWCIKQIKIEALKIGADGVIITGRVGSSGAGVPVGGIIVTSNRQYGMKAIAIKYKN
jgi:hypothetical protein